MPIGGRPRLSQSARPTATLVGFAWSHFRGNAGDDVPATFAGNLVAGLFGPLVAGVDYVDRP